MQKVMFSFRITPTDKRLALRLAKQERRTLSNFLINLIHERQAAVAVYRSAGDATTGTPVLERTSQHQAFHP